MKLSLFMMPLHNLGRDYSTTLKEDIEAIVYADQLGFSEAWVGEHYTSSVEPITSPLTFLAHVAPLTKQITLGTGVACLPQYNPVLVAGQAAMVDHLTDGRFILGVGVGGLVSDMEVFNVEDQNRVEMMIESVDLIQKMWTETPPYTLKGKYWTISNEKYVWPDVGMGEMLKPKQLPSPPIAVSASSPNSGSIRLAARKGWIPVSANFVAAWNVKTHWEAYCDETAKTGGVADPEIWHVARSIHVADTDAEAEAYVKKPGGTFDWYFDYLLRIYKRVGATAAVVVKPDDDPAAVDHVVQRDDFVIHGSPETVARKILELRDYIGPFGTLMMAAHDWQDKAAMKRSLELMATKVMPMVNAAIAAKEPAEASAA
ncbi:LLM class flavin-dependent oxidoreductase [Starkeya sp. ORNL1]|uniref:LLM class flavin-dependent oxidoreductase n=1 Tax=Starkeya sp. ORNL1 TaxID=2709380 RepID=UPI00146301EA|nr:LLM class flavin-dependent oxidoreductase [Starkeya sp. ORNL1]QJP14235.1 LLM class flavin-dependent oxidoreductase [Starkeya sp. ORNL1]